MAVLETTVTNLDKKISDIQSDVKAIIITLSKQPTLESEIISLKNEIEALKKQNGVWKWLAPTLTAVATATVTFLVIFFLQHNKI